MAEQSNARVCKTRVRKDYVGASPTPSTNDYMTRATETETNLLRTRYGLRKPHTGCFHNAFSAWLQICHQELIIKNTFPPIPRIWQVNLPEDRVHAYLEYDGRIYNQGVTWPQESGERYPDYSLEEIVFAQQKGYAADKTETILGYALITIDKITSPSPNKLLSFSPIENDYLKIMLTSGINSNDLQLILVGGYCIITNTLPFDEDTSADHKATPSR